MFVRNLVMAALLLTVAACNKNPFEVVVSRCLAVAVVGDLGTVTKFDGSGHTTNDVEYTASIMDLTGNCEEAEDVRSEVSFTVGANAGPAMSGRSVTVPYFVAVLKDNSQIVSKKVFDVTLRFDSEGKASSVQTIGQHIPTIEQARRYNYELLVGFQMEAQEVVYNMERQ
jgi:hypothetical protein